MPSTSQPGVTRSGTRVLVVDNNRLSRQVVEKNLTTQGFLVRTISSGTEALSEARRFVPDLVLVDQFLDEMTGAIFCEALRGITNLATIPIVMMVTQPKHFTEVEHVVTDSIRKPFDGDSILTIVTHLSSRRPHRKAIERVFTAPDRETVETRVAPKTETTRFSRRLALILAPTLKQERVANIQADHLEKLIDSALTPDITSELAHRLSEDMGRSMMEAPGRHLDEPSFQGKLEHFPLGDLLQVMHGQTGTLTIVHAPTSKNDTPHEAVLCMHKGHMDLAMAHGISSEFLLGRFLLAENLIAEEDLSHLLALGGGRTLLGKRLVTLGYISASDLEQALVRQTSEIIYEALRWRRGRYRFDRYVRPPEATQAALGLNITGILMEGLRRVDEWGLIEEQIPGFDAVPHTTSANDVEGLTPLESQVMVAIDGVRSVRAVVEAVGQSSFDICKVLYRLSVARHIQFGD